MPQNAKFISNLYVTAGIVPRRYICLIIPSPVRDGIVTLTEEQGDTPESGQSNDGKHDTAQGRSHASEDIGDRVETENADAGIV